MVETPNQSQPNTGVQADGTPCSADTDLLSPPLRCSPATRPSAGASLA